MNNGDAMQMLAMELHKFSQSAPYTMQEVSRQLQGFNANAQMFMGQYMPMIEMNFLSQASVNPQLSEEARNLATARLEGLIKATYGKEEAKQFK